MNEIYKTDEIPQVFLQILKNRGLKERGEIAEFLFPKLTDLPKPDAMQGMAEAVDLIYEYLTAEKPIIVWGDYDVDGTTGTALLVNFFRSIGKEIDWHIPNRLHEGYGLNIDWFRKSGKYKVKQDFLLITVDCGISDVEVINQIMQMKGRVIVTDHHSLPKTSLPDCIILNPSQGNCGFNGKCLAGVGVAFYLAAGVRAKVLSAGGINEITQEINLKQFLAFVALGTIADLVHLSPTNRILVKGGIEVLKITQFPGISALLHSCDIQDGSVNSEDIGFLLGPLINAAGRMGDSETVVKLLTSTVLSESEKLVKKLVRLNSKRKSICINDLEVSLDILNNIQVLEDRCVVLAGDIHQGVAGIVASRLVDTFGVPVIILGLQRSETGETLLVGSARSVEGVSIVNAINQCSEFLLKYGGHDMAAGLTLLKSNFNDFRQKIQAVLLAMMDAKPVVPANRNDFYCPVADLMSEKYLAFLQLLEPFGPGNELPVFKDNNAKIVNSKRVGRTSEHLQIFLRGKYSNYKGIGFGLGKHRDEIQQNPERTIRYTPTKNRFRGTTSWQVRIIDI